jgi:hypothetical protein
MLQSLPFVRGAGGSKATTARDGDDAERAVTRTAAGLGQRVRDLDMWGRPNHFEYLELTWRWTKGAPLYLSGK